MSRLLCRLGFHNWEFDFDTPGFGFDRRYETCTRCPAGRHIDHDGTYFRAEDVPPSSNKGHIFEVHVYPNGHKQRIKRCRKS